MWKIGLRHGSDRFRNSNLLTPTNFYGVPASGTHFFKLSQPLSDTVVKRKPLKSISGYPYRPARIVPGTLDITKRWHVVFYAWDIGKERLERKRVLQDELMAFDTLEKRQAAAEGIVEEINYFLKHDWHLFSSPAPKAMEVDFKSHSIIDALNYALNYKGEIEGVKEVSLAKYREVVSTVKDFLAFKKLPADYALRNLNGAFVNQYFAYIKTDRGNSNKTYNDKKAVLNALANVLIGQNPRLFDGINPFSKVKLLKTESRKHAAFTDDQLRRLIDLAEKKGWRQIALFIRYMYYSLARGKELAALKVGHNDLPRRRILFPSESAKTGIEDYVGINDRLAEIIAESGILKFPQDYFVFSNAPSFHGPGPVKVGKNYFYKRISELIEELGFYKVNENHTPYSIKHTGAIALYLATRNIKLVQQQCRHKNLETTIKYLRDLGVFTDFDELNKLKGVI